MTQAVAPSGELALRPAPPDGRAISPNGADAATAPAAEAVPRRPRGLELLGEFAGSGHRRPPSLVRRADGQTIQLTPVLYRLLCAIDGRTSYAELASRVGSQVGKAMTAEQVRFLVNHKLQPLGLVGSSDGGEPPLQKANPLLAIRLRYMITNPRTTRAIATPFSALFFPPIVVAFLAAFVLTTGWLIFDRGIAAAARHALYEPSLLLLVFVLTMLSAAFHELGHACACRYGGARPGAMGVGLYLIWPAFYTDVSDAYRLDRRGRLRTDLGGIYFNAVFAVLAFGLWAMTRWEALLIVIPLQVFAMVRQLVPFVRLDGYHILADLTGVPDLFAHIKPILRSMWPSNWRSPDTQSLRPKVRAIVTLWVILVVPLLLAMFAAIVVTFPKVAATAWDSADIRWEQARSGWTSGDPAAALVSLLSMFAIAIPVLSMGYLVARVVRRTATRVWGATSGRPLMRTLSILVAGALVASLAIAWWPKGQYEPIGATDRGAVDVRFRDAPLVGRVFTMIDTIAQRPSSDPYLGSPSQEITGEEVPATLAADAEITAGETEHAPEEATSDFRFNEPDPPGEGDNQALAVNYEDGTSVFEMAISLLFDTDDVVDQQNEAWALASCDNCSAVAVAFQVLLILEEADVVVPQNVSVAVNALCTECFTYSLAFQTIYSLSAPLSDAATAELTAVWDILEEVQANIEDIPIDQLYPTLLAIQEAIIEILEGEGAAGSGSDAVDGGETPGEPGVTPSPTDPGASTTPDPDTTEEPTPSPEPEPEPTGDPSPEPSPDPTPTAEPDPTPEPTP